MVRFGRRSLTVLAVALLVVCLAVANAGASRKSYRELLGFLGPVHSVLWERAEYTEKFGEWIEGSRLKHRFHAFTPDGRELEWAWYKDDGSLDFRYVYTYDDRGHISELVYTSAYSRNNRREVYQLDDTGRILRSNEYGDDGSLNAVVVYRYDDSSREETTYTPDGMLCVRVVRTYDDSGNEIDWALYNADGSLSSRRSSRCDSAGNVVEETWYGRGGMVERKLVYRYDERGRRIETTGYKAYDVLDYREVYVSDDMGNYTELTCYNASGSIQRKFAYTYEYDSYSNWTKQVCFRWVTKFGKSYWEPQWVTYRTITYY